MNEHESIKKTIEGFKYRYLNSLMESRKLLENELKDFPNSCCNESTYFLSRVFGFEQKAGYARVKFNNDLFKYKEHAWNRFGNLDVCLSMNQFDNEFETYEKIFVNGKHNSSLYADFFEGNFQKGTWGNVDKFRQEIDKLIEKNKSSLKKLKYNIL